MLFNYKQKNGGKNNDAEAMMNPYPLLTQLVFGKDCDYDQADMERLQHLTVLTHQHFQCVVCSKLLDDPYEPANGRCTHYVCRLCMSGKKRDDLQCPYCADCCDYRTYNESEATRAMLDAYHYICSMLRDSPVFLELNRNVQRCIVEGANYDDSLNAFKDDLRLGLPDLSELYNDEWLLDYEETMDNYCKPATPPHPSTADDCLFADSVVGYISGGQQQGQQQQLVTNHCTINPAPGKQQCAVISDVLIITPPSHSTAITSTIAAENFANPIAAAPVKKREITPPTTTTNSGAKRTRGCRGRRLSKSLQNLRKIVRKSTGGGGPKAAAGKPQTKVCDCGKFGPNKRACNTMKCPCFLVSAKCQNCRCKDMCKNPFNALEREEGGMTQPKATKIRSDDEEKEEQQPANTETKAEEATQEEQQQEPTASTPKLIMQLVDLGKDVTQYPPIFCRIGGEASYLKALNDNGVELDPSSLGFPLCELSLPAEKAGAEAKKLLVYLYEPPATASEAKPTAPVAGVEPEIDDRQLEAEMADLVRDDDTVELLHETFDNDDNQAAK